MNEEVEWQVKVKRGARKTQSGKNLKKELTPPRAKLDTLKCVKEHGQLMAVAPEQWVEVRLTVDSGAGESVVPASDAPNVEAVKGDKYGNRYEVANGEIITNQGEKRCAMVTEDSRHPRHLTLQVSEVHKGLLSVIEMIRKGQRVVFDQDWSYIQDKSTGQCDTLVQTDDSFELVTWVKPANKVNKEDFPRPGR